MIFWETYKNVFFLGEIFGIIFQFVIPVLQYNVIVVETIFNVFTFNFTVNRKQREVIRVSILILNVNLSEVNL